MHIFTLEAVPTDPHVNHESGLDGFNRQTFPCNMGAATFMNRAGKRLRESEKQKQLNLCIDCATLSMNPVNTYFG